jgi:hypothetical protein
MNADERMTTPATARTASERILRDARRIRVSDFARDVVRTRQIARRAFWLSALFVGSTSLLFSALYYVMNFS